MIRVVLLGDSCSGKTALFDTLLYGGWHESFCTTITPSFGKYLDKFVLYDTPGTNRWTHFAKPYLQVADAAIIVYDVNKGNNSVEKWRNYLLENNRRQIPILVVGNKVDLKQCEKENNVVYISCKKGKDVANSLQPFFDTLEHDPKILIGWVEYLYLLLPTAKDVTDRIPAFGCLQQ